MRWVSVFASSFFSFGMPAPSFAVGTPCATSTPSGLCPCSALSPNVTVETPASGSNPHAVVNTGSHTSFFVNRGAIVVHSADS